MGPGILPVPGPRHLFITLQCHASCLEVIDHRGRCLRVPDGKEDLAQFQRVLRHADQRNFEQAVLQVDPAARDICKSSDRSGIRDHPECEFTVDHSFSPICRDGRAPGFPAFRMGTFLLLPCPGKRQHLALCRGILPCFRMRHCRGTVFFLRRFLQPLRFHVHVVGPHIAQLRYALKNIGQVADLVFQFLWRLVRGARKDPEGRHVGKIVRLIEEAKVAAEGPALRDDLCRLPHICGNVQARCKIIGRSRGNISDRHKGLVRIFHHAADDLVQRPVPAGADDIQIVLLALAHDPPGVPLPPGGITEHFKIRSRQGVDDVRQIFPDLGATRHRIIDKKDFFPEHASTPFPGAKPRMTKPEMAEQIVYFILFRSASQPRYPHMHILQKSMQASNFRLPCAHVLLFCDSSVRVESSKGERKRTTSPERKTS